MRSNSVAILALAAAACWAGADASAQAAVGPIEGAGEQFRLELLIEAVGVFWIVAEVAILYCMTAAVRLFATRPFPAHISLTQAERKRALRWALAMAGLVAAVFGRHIFIAPLPEAFGAIAAAGGNVQALAEQAYNTRTHIHIALWCSFITAWVLLEIAIVIQGIRAYKHIRGLTLNG